MEIKRRIRKTGGKILYLYKCIKWYIFLLKTKNEPLKQNFKISDEWYSKGRVLLLAPHADDELLSSYTLLKRCPDLTVYYCGFTGTNQSKKNASIRRAEITMLCKKCGVPIIDGRGDCYNLEQIVDDYDILLIPSIVDWHNEHRKVSYILYKILKKMNRKFKIYSYSVTVPNESGREILVLPMTQEEQDEKYSVFYCVYKSQKFMPIYRFRINERINGYYVNAYSAEVFLPHDFGGWMCETNKLMKLEQNEDEILVNHIKNVANTGNLRTIRQASSAFYSYVERED